MADFASSARCLPALLLAAIAGSPLAAQSRRATDPPPSNRATLVAHVVDDSTGRPVPGAHVMVGDAGAYTDSAGVARVGRIPAGSRMVAAGMLGYGTERVVVEFTPGAQVEAEIRLSLEPLPISGLEVTASGRDRFLANEGFYRRTHFAGTFMYGAAFEERARRVSGLHELFWGVRGVYVATGRYGGRLLASSRGVTSLPGANSLMLRPCYMKVLLDGMDTRYESSFRPDIDWLVPASSVAAIEVYAGAAETPMEFGSVSPCGTVLLWTKRGR